ncbi:MAG: DUF1460 domain-containing protein [Bacteroidaceae bacterium]|nr:DUF1460 domain-containing protein [Bacteroidaceae bacterium]
MRRLLFLILILHSSLLSLHSRDEDSLRVVTLLTQGQREATQPLHLWYARQLLGVPYVGQTLEVNAEERLVVNLRELDCTTFVETALALALTHAGGSTRFEDYCRHLTRIRYRDGLLDGYASRNHYFTQWIQSNERQGIVRELTAGQAPFTAVQTLDLHFMSDHPQYYPMLKSDTAAQRLIRHYELAGSGRPVRYIPRSQLNQLQDSPLGVVRDGDILAIVTRKDGLDTSHIGLAVWGRDRRLHLLNASQIHKQVVLEPMTLYQYMGKHPSQLGIRVIRVTEP